GVQEVFEVANLLADSRRRDAKLNRGEPEASMACGRVEDAKQSERGKLGEPSLTPPLPIWLQQIHIAFPLRAKLLAGVRPMGLRHSWATTTRRVRPLVGSSRRPNQK